MKQPKPSRLTLPVTVYLMLFAAALLGCGPSPPVRIVQNPSTGIASTPENIEAPSPRVTPISTIDLVEAPPSTPTFVPTVTSSPTQLATATPTITGTPVSTLPSTPIAPCDLRLPAEPLLAIITLKYNISRDYVPIDLIPLSELLPPEVTLGYLTEIRQIASLPLVEMINDMRSDGLQPTIISGYRSFAAQTLAWSKWLANEPDRASILSAPPGYSEHQLGTTVDFGSPELAEIIGDDKIQFHTYFYMTSESNWLEENAYKYGFTLSYPRRAFELTGFYYEPWHYRYVGSELATQLKQSGSFLTEYQFQNRPVPCIP